MLTLSGGSCSRGRNEDVVSSSFNGSVLPSLTCTVRSQICDVEFERAELCLIVMEKRVWL